MRNEEIIKRVAEGLSSFGVPEHLRSIKKIPSRIEVELLNGSQRVRRSLRNGITVPEFERQFCEIGCRWRQDKDGQLHLEDAIAKTEPTSTTPAEPLRRRSAQAHEMGAAR